MGIQHQRVTFKPIAPGAPIYGATCDVLYAVFGAVEGTKRRETFPLRIDGRDGTFRVDRLGTLGTIWEAIDGGQGFSTLEQATVYARSWCKAANAQSTLQPRDVPRHPSRRSRSRRSR